MPPGTELLVGETPLTFLFHPPYSEAHPDEEGDEPCTQCAVARRHDTGESVLLWMCEGKNWIVSRADPEWSRHRTELDTAASVRPAYAAA